METFKTTRNKRMKKSLSAIISSIMIMKIRNDLKYQGEAEYKDDFARCVI
jgi:hypothetical protein